MTTIYRICDASGEYLAGNYDADGDLVLNGRRTPAWDEAMQWEDRAEAEAALSLPTARKTDRLVVDEIED